VEEGRAEEREEGVPSMAREQLAASFWWLAVRGERNLALIPC
jgi:hypothetical protein